MAKAEDIIREQLLKEMDEDSSELLDADANSAQRIIQNYQVRVSRLKWITLTSWLITVLYWVAINYLHVWVKDGHWEFRAFYEVWLIRYPVFWGPKTLALITGVLTYLYFSRSKTLTVLQICVRLTGIEEQLKRIAQDKSSTRDVDGSGQGR